MLQVYADPTYFQGGQHSGYATANYAAQESALRATFRCFIQTLHKHGLTGGDLLEIGCGYGYLLDAAQPYFTSLTATDYDPDAARRAAESPAQTPVRQIIIGGAEHLPADSRFDVMISTGVIEHVYQPVAFVRQLALHLRANGWMVFATPKMDSFWRRWQGRRWPSFKIPEHVVYYDPHTLAALFRHSGAVETVVLPYPAAYPAALIAAKLGLALPLGATPVFRATPAFRVTPVFRVTPAFRAWNLWLPDTMFAVAARFPGDASEVAPA